MCRDGSIGGKKDTLEQWERLQILGLYPRRRPVLDIAEVIGVPKTEEIADGAQESLDGAGWGESECYWHDEGAEVGDSRMEQTQDMR